jgi:hypothetical protein
MKYKFSAGHYLLCDAGGLSLIIWIAGRKIIGSISNRRVYTVRRPNHEKSDAGFPEISWNEKSCGL